MQNANLHLVRTQLVEHLGECFLRALHIAFQQKRYFFDFALGQLLVQLIERKPRRLGQRDIAQFFLPIRDDLPCLFVVGDALERVTGHGQSFKAKYLNRRRRLRLLHHFGVLVEHRANFAVNCARNKVVTDAQRAVLNENRCNIATTFIDFGFKHSTHCRQRGIRFEVLKVRDE